MLATSTRHGDADAIRSLVPDRPDPDPRRLRPGLFRPPAGDGQLSGRCWMAPAALTDAGASDAYGGLQLGLAAWLGLALLRVQMRPEVTSGKTAFFCCFPASVFEISTR